MKNHPLEAIISLYLSEKDITRGTMELYSTILKQYSIYLSDNQILYAKTSDVLRYIEWKRSQGYSTSWIFNQIAAIKGLYRYLSQNQKRLGLPVEYSKDITEPIRNFQVKNRQLKSYLSIEQAKQLIETTKTNRRYIWQYRDYALIYLMLTTGLRSIEIRRARKKDLRMIGQQCILDVQGKGRQSADEYVKITKGVEAAIRDYLNKRQDNNPYLFISHRKKGKSPYLSRTFFIRMFDRVLKECKLEDTHITAHSLRHSAATFNMQRGASLESTRLFMRHRELSTTIVYTHDINRLKDDSENLIEDYILGEEV